MTVDREEREDLRAPPTADDAGMDRVPAVEDPDLTDESNGDIHATGDHLLTIGETVAGHVPSASTRQGACRHHAITYTARAVVSPMTTQSTTV